MKAGLSGILRWRKEKLTARTMGIPLVVLVAISLILAASGCFTPGHWPACTGLVDYVGPTTEDGREFQRGKTVWDWIQLLIVPLVLAGGALWFNQRRDQIEREVAADRQREEALQAYLNVIGKLMLEKGLRPLKDGLSPEDEPVREAARDVARAQTLTVLRRMDAERKGAILRFLHESELIKKTEESEPVIALHGCDLSGADLSWADLRDVDLSRTDLSWANLFLARLNRASLHRANLRNADLRSFLSQSDLSAADLRKADLIGASIVASLVGADLSSADLTEADVSVKQLAHASSLRGATMPDGSRYDGRFRLPRDIDLAQSLGIEPVDPEAMADFYAVSLHDYLRALEWGEENLPELQKKAATSDDNH